MENEIVNDESNMKENFMQMTISKWLMVMALSFVIYPCGGANLDCQCS